jgi:hypothetical protein
MIEIESVKTSILSAIKSSKDKRGINWIDLTKTVCAKTSCSNEELREGFFLLLDDCQVEEAVIGWIKLVEDQEAMKKADDAKLERHMEDQAERDQQLAREHDYARQHSAEGN